MITSLSNPTVKEIRKLRERKERERSGYFFIEGLRILGEAVENQAEMVQLITAPELLVSNYGKEIAQKIQTSGITGIEVTGEIFRHLSLKDGPQGIGAIVKERWDSLGQQRLQGDWVALDSVQDPGNLGTILRTNDAVGGEGIILLDFSTDPYDPVTVRASMGAVFSQKMIRVKLDEFTQWKYDRNIHVFGAAGGASDDYHSTIYPRPLVLLMGSERIGLTPKHISICDKIVSIPMVGRSDSLNLAVATGVILYEIFNQRRDHKSLLPDELSS